MDGNWRRGLRRVVPILAVCLVGTLFAAPSALGQAAVDQYVPSPNPAPPTGGVAGATGGGSKTKGTKTKGTEGTGANGSVAAQSGSGSSGGGTLPFTGYPITPLVWIALGALVAGVLMRVGAARLKRRGARGAT
jgi:hypothetical protein